MAKTYFCNEKSTADTPNGKLRGYFADGVYVFHGIRYAKAKRFQMPTPVEPWEGVKDALSYGYICPVLDNPMPTNELGCTHRFWPENEHCQYLNIWTTELKPSAKKPVMVWLHGGGFSAGSSIEQVCYEGDNLSKFGDVVVVSINHRLNVFGHLDMSAFGEKYKNSVNAGIADIVEALRWIKNNISAFGGDPGNVTIVGQSGGGGKVTTLGQIPAAAGLFHKAIVMSGVLDDSLMGATVDPKERVLAILAELGIPENEAERLERVPTALLIRAVNKAEKKLHAAGKRTTWAPMPDDYYVGDPLSVGFTEYYRTVPTIVGSVMCEFSGFFNIPNKDELSAEERRAAVASRFGEENADRAIELFKAAFPGKNEVYTNLVDTVFRPLSVRYARKKTEESSAPVYCYLFNLEFNEGGTVGAGHCSDIPFFFHNTDRLPINWIEGVTEKLERQMAGAFVNFARSGNPNAAELPGWAPCTKDEVVTMNFDRECEAKVNFDDELMDFAAKTLPPFSFNFPDPEDEDEEGGSAWVF